jgi:hypothetical protein
LNEWLRTPEVVRWWGDPEEQAALLRADLLQADLDEPRMAMRIVSFAGPSPMRSTTPCTSGHNRISIICLREHVRSMPSSVNRT